MVFGEKRLLLFKFIFFLFVAITFSQPRDEIQAF